MCVHVPLYLGVRSAGGAGVEGSLSQDGHNGWGKRDFTDGRQRRGRPTQQPTTREKQHGYRWGGMCVCVCQPPVALFLSVIIQNERKC